MHSHRLRLQNNRLVHKKAILAGLLLAPLASLACPPGLKQDLGTLLGTVIDAGVNSALGEKHRNQNAAIAVDTFFGGLFGYRLGARLDQEMTERMLYTVLEKFPTGETGQWMNPDSRSRGSVTVTRTNLIETPGHIQLCREFTTTIVIGSKEYEGCGTACRQSDGSWKIVDRKVPPELLSTD